MANPHKGEVGFECGGRNYVLRYSTNAICELENVLDLNVLGISALMSNAEALRMSTVRAVLWAGLLDKQPQTTMVAAGDLMTEIGYGRTLELIGDAFGKAFPQGDDNDARPPVPGQTGPAGTGQSSSDHGVNSASPTSNSGTPRLVT